MRAPSNQAVRTFARVLLVTAVATQLTYPIGYDAILKTHSWMPVVVLDLAIRNVPAGLADLVRGAPGVAADPAARPAERRRRTAPGLLAELSA